MNSINGLHNQRCSDTREQTLLHEQLQLDVWNRLEGVVVIYLGTKRRKEKQDKINYESFLLLCYNIIK